MVQLGVCQIASGAGYWAGRSVQEPAGAVQNPDHQANVQESAEEQAERVAAERFFDLLKKRPRQGTALDKVYGYHVGRGTLDAFSGQLEVDATEQNDGNLWMIPGMVQMQRGQDAEAAQRLERAEKLLPAEPLASHYLGRTLV